MADRYLFRVGENVAGPAGAKRAATARHQHLQAEGTGADATLHRLSLPAAGNLAQDYAERSTPTACDQILLQLSQPGGAAGKRVAVGAGRIQGGVVCDWAR